jgi:hypothetical protein
MASRGQEAVVKDTFVCSACDHVSMLRTDLQRHMMTCVKYQINEAVKERDLEIEFLKKEIVEKNQRLDEKEAHISRLTDRILSPDSNKVNSVTTTTRTYTINNEEEENDENEEMSESDRQYVAYVQALLQQLNIGQYVQQYIREHNGSNGNNGNNPNCNENNESNENNENQ